MSLAALQVLSPGWGATVQAGCRVGWRKFGVPPGGPMDEHAASWANRLLENPPGAPLLELLLQGAQLAALQDLWVAITGADAAGTVPTWRSLHLRSGQRIEFGPSRVGVWTYLAVEGGLSATSVLGSASTYARAGLGTVAQPGNILWRAAGKGFTLPAGVATRLAPPLEQHDYSHPPLLRVWPAPQWPLFEESVRAAFFSQAWIVSPQSDRVGYRLTGKALSPVPPQILSEPVRMGTIQVPEGGLPIVTMRDGPTLGGYPKLGVLEPGDLSWLAQCRPGQTVRFRPMTEHGHQL